MKNNRTTRLVVLVLFLAIITAIILSGTFAKYTTSVDGNGTAEIAKWSFSASGLDTFARTDGVSVDKIADTKLAPGTSGSFSASVDCTGCEVAVDYKVVISNIQNKPTNLKFYSDSTFNTEISESNGEFVVEGTVAANAASKTVSVPVYWKWAYETASGDATDTLEGEAATAMTIDIAVVGTQADPTK